MAILNLTFDTGAVTLAQLTDGLAKEWGYREQIPDPLNPGQMIPNPQTKAQFNREQLKRILREAYRNGNRKILLEQSEANVPDITIT